MSAAIQLTLPGHQPHLPPFERFTPLPRRAIRDRHLTDFDRTVLALLIDLAGPKGLTCTATNAALARELGTCEQAIRVSLARLEAAGYGCRVPDRCAGLAHRRVDFLFRTWDKALNPEGGGRGGPPPRPAAQARRRARPRRARRRAPGAIHGAPPLPYWFEFKLRIKTVRKRPDGRSARTRGRDDGGDTPSRRRSPLQGER